MSGGTKFTGGPQDSPGYLLWHATLRWQRMVTAALAPLGLTHVQFVLLTCLWWLHGQKVEPNQLALARQAGTDVKMTSQVLRALERKGLVERRTDPADTRAKTVHLTAAGSKLARRAVVVVEAADEQFFAAATRGSSGGTERLVAFLRRLAPLPADLSA
jgi:DNA-binding MarR family transcriptional regulator